MAPLLDRFAMHLYPRLWRAIDPLSAVWQALRRECPVGNHRRPILWPPSGAPNGRLIRPFVDEEGTNTDREEPPEDTAKDTAKGASFVHRATDGNSRGDYTYLSDPAIDGEPGAVVLATASAVRGGAQDAYGHNVGVWYEAGAQKWAIFNQDLAAVPAGATFRVVLPPASESFVHRARPADIVRQTTYLDDPLTNGEPDAVVSVTQNWNPGGGPGVYNDHPVGLLYDEDVQKWAVYNRDGARMPDGAAFNVAVSGSDESAR